jgi:leader peptidase (prepilin peptidase)/N-methyltransferase
MLARTMDPEVWASLPFHFWTVVLFVFGTMVGSFLNVCIHRLPLGQSIVSPPSHCPHCKYSIPWYLNVPLITWLYLRGKCANCRAPISIRYFLVESLTGLMFAACWIGFGGRSPLVALIYCLLIAGLIAATFIDFEHFIIPDEITLGGMVVGFVLSFLVPALHDAGSLTESVRRSLLGMAVGAGIVYGILRIGKLLFGKQKLDLKGETQIFFTETCLHYGGKDVPYEELFYRQSDVIALQARRLELVDRCYRDVLVRLSPSRLQVGDEVLNPEEVPYMEALSSEIVLPREAMGLGDVKFMGAIGAFLGWQAVIFSLMVSSLIGSMVGVALIVMRRQAWSSRLPYGPYIAIASVVWIFCGMRLVTWWFGR